MTAARGRWVVDEKGELVEVGDKPTAAELHERDTEEARKKREQAERDAHPGNYV